MESAFNAPVCLHSEGNLAATLRLMCDYVATSLDDLRLPSSRLHAILNNVEGLEIRGRFQALIVTLAAEAVGYTAVYVDYNEPHAIQRMVEGGSFTYVNFDGIGPDQIPIRHNGSGYNEVKEMQFKAGISTREIQAELSRQGLEFADSLTALLYAQARGSQPRPPLVTIFEHAGWTFYLSLGWKAEGAEIEVSHCAIGSNWVNGSSFLVRKKQVI